jgi:DNA-binding MarR family transcriptional regulator
MEPRSQTWSDFSFVVSSGYREKVLASLAPKPKLPMQLAGETNLRIAHVSRALRELSDRGLVACLTPDVKARGRLYGLTEVGAGLLDQMTVSRGRFSVPVAPARVKPGAEPFVPKIRGSSVVRFLDYLRKVRGTRAVADAIRDWSVDPAGLTEETWLSVESCAEFLDLIERAFGDGSYGYIRKLFCEAMSTFPTVREQLTKAIPLTALAERAPIVYAKEWNYGRLEVSTDRRKVTMRHYDWMPTAAMCAMFHGIYEGGLAYRRVKGKVTKTQCVRNGSDHCEYVVEW